MVSTLLEKRLAFELPAINKALNAAVAGLPVASRPVASHILDAGGKRLRPFLTVMCARLLGHASDDIYILAASMEMLHAATLLHDDVLDNAPSRRGRPSAHTIFGQAAAILAGDALLAGGNAIVAAFGKPALCLCYSQATSNTAAGEILEMNSLRDPALSHEQYLEIARGKTGCLISGSCALGALIADAAPVQVRACTTFGENLGIAFQLVDDALDFAPQDQTGKPSGGDLREGKMTPPLRLYRQSLDADQQAVFDKNFSKGTFDEDTLETIIAECASFGAAARALADTYLKQAVVALELLPDGEDRAVLLEMAEYVRSRSN